MKFSKIALACSLATAAMSAQAVEVPGAAAATVIYFTGASAPDNFLSGVVGTMFTGTVTRIDGTGNSNYRAFLGKAASGITGVTAGSDIVLVKRSAGGSVFGVDPVARSQSIAYMNVKSANCVAVGNPATSYTCPIEGSDPANAAANGTGLVPDFGISDVEPALFKAPYNVENNNTQLSGTELSRLVVKPVNQLMMGLVATNSVSASTNLSRTQYAAALAGKYGTWAAIDGSEDSMVVCRRVNGSGTQASYNWFFSGFPCNSSSNGFVGNAPVRADASQGYDGSTAGTAADPFIIDPTQGLTIVENSGSGDVRNCLSNAYYGFDHFTQGDSGKYYRVTFSGVAGTPAPATFTLTGTNTDAPLPSLRGGPSKAIGVLSLDSYRTANANYAFKPYLVNGTSVTQPSTYTSNAGSGWSFRQLDGAGTFDGVNQTASAGATGVSPSKANLVSGKYDFVVELTMQRRNNLTGDKLGFFNELSRRLGLVSNTASTTIPASSSAVPFAYATLPTVESYDSNPTTVSKQYRGGNTCSPLVVEPSL
jgi:hypothetical protein